jgi:tRNA(fMet)-specific endonuclease VapC
MLDTNAYSGFKRGDREIVELIARADEVLITPIVLGELRAGFSGGNRENANLLELEEFIASPRASVVPIGEETAIFYSEIYATLWTQGKPIPTNDLWIAASTLETGSILISRDIHFDTVGGLIRR